MPGCEFICAHFEDENGVRLRRSVKGPCGKPAEAWYLAGEVGMIRLRLCPRHRDFCITEYRWNLINPDKDLPDEQTL